MDYLQQFPNNHDYGHQYTYSKPLVNCYNPSTDSELQSNLDGLSYRSVIPCQERYPDLETGNQYTSPKFPSGENTGKIERIKSSLPLKKRIVMTVPESNEGAIVTEQEDPYSQQCNMLQAKERILNGLQSSVIVENSDLPHFYTNANRNIEYLQSFQRETVNPYTSTDSKRHFGDLHPQSWSENNVQSWICSLIRTGKIAESCADQLILKLSGKTGEDILTFSRQNWNDVSAEYGNLLFESLREMTTDKRYELGFTVDLTENKSYALTNNAKPEEKRRPRRRRDKRVGQLWEFMLRLLINPETNPSIICWEDKSRKLFRIVNTEKIALLWGKHKDKSTMTYANMSRTMRYYQKGKGAFIRDDRKRVYGFGPKADLKSLLQKIKKESAVGGL